MAVKPFNGLAVFPSCVLNNNLYVGGIGVSAKLDGVWIAYRIRRGTSSGSSP